MDQTVYNVQNGIKQNNRNSALKNLASQRVVDQASDPGVASSIPARFHSFVEIDHEIISPVILLLLLFQKGLLSATSESMCMKYWLTA